jgi:hypothetical protein
VSMAPKYSVLLCGAAVALQRKPASGWPHFFSFASGSRTVGMKSDVVGPGHPAACARLISDGGRPASQIASCRTWLASRRSAWRRNRPLKPTCTMTRRYLLNQPWAANTPGPASIHDSAAPPPGQSNPFVGCERKPAHAAVAICR